jgi:hypothetical protein
VVWDESLSTHGAWDSDPCVTVVSDQTGTTCECKVFGTFAIVAEFIEEPSVSPECVWLKVTKYLGFSLSLICCLIFVGTVALAS